MSTYTRWTRSRQVNATFLAIIVALAMLLVPATAQAADTSWQGEYYSNQWLSGAPTLIRYESATPINYDWNYGSPDQRIPVDHFLVRWTRLVYFDGGRYVFTTESDDGVRLYVDGNLVIDKWRGPVVDGLHGRSEPERRRPCPPLGIL